LKKKKTSQKRAGRVAQSVGPEFKFQYQKKNKVEKLETAKEVFIPKIIPAGRLRAPLGLCSLACGLVGTAWTAQT
jgi:hypothetical protein